MGCLRFFLSFEKPEVNLARSKQDVVRVRLVDQAREDVVRAVADLINDLLDQRIGANVPNVDQLVSAERDQVVPILIDR